MGLFDEIRGIFETITGIGGRDAGRAASEAADIQAGWQGKALKYLKETERLPMQYRNQALSRLSQIYGLPGISGVGGDGGGGTPMGPQPSRYAPGNFMVDGKVMTGGAGEPIDMGMGADGVYEAGPGGMVSPYTDRAGFIEGLEQDPFYEMLLSGGEDVIGRTASMTGGLRSGATVEDLVGNQQDVLRQLYGQRMGEFSQMTSGLTGLAGIPSMAPQIAGLTSDIGRTYAQGKIGQAQAMQQGTKDQFNTILGIGSLFI